MAAPVHQMQQYYRLGALDNCSEKWTALVDCLSLKTKRSTEVQVCFSNFIHLWIFLFFILFYCASLFLVNATYNFNIKVLNQMLHGLIFTTMLLVACVSIHNVSR
jgi:hypothetical protein